LCDYHKPNLLLSYGDWGSAINPEELYELLKKTIILTIYGNHENTNVLTKLYNVKSENYMPILMEAGINGIIAKKRKNRKDVPRKTAEDFSQSC